MATYIHPFQASNQHHSGSGYSAHISYENAHFQHRIPVSPAAHEPQPYPITHGIPIYPAYLPPPHASSSLTTKSEPPIAPAAPAQPSSSSSSADTSSRTTKHAPSRTSTPAIPLPPTARRSSNDAPSAMAPLRDMPSPIIPISASSSPASSPTSSPTSSPERVKREPSKSAQPSTVRNPPRGVHFTEDLVCPTPPPHAPRRKGFFNRRGDQLWTNAGGYKPADPSDLYPPDLDSYPEPGDGWENEDGVRIDMKHRRMPGASIRPVLKKTPTR